MKTILVVEDNHMMRILLKDLLEEWEYKVFLARDGRDALTILQVKKDIDLILSDVIMPEINGIELLRIVKEKYKIPVVIMSSGEYENEVLELGARTFLQKPFSNFKMLETEIANAFSKKVHK